MPLGSFRLNTLAKYLPPEVSAIPSWENFTSANITNRYTLTSDWNTGATVPMDDTYGVISYCTGAAVNTQRTVPYTRNGSQLILGTETTRTFTRGTDRTYSGVKMGDYAVFVADFGRRIIAGQWTGTTNYTWGSEQVFAVETIDRISARAVSDTCLLVIGAFNNTCIIRLFSRNGGTFTHQSDTTINFTILGYLTQIAPCEDSNKFVVSLAGSSNSQAALITVNTTNFTLTQNSIAAALTTPFVTNTNSNSRAGQTITSFRGNNGILTYSQYVANYQYVEIVPFSVSGNTLTLHTANAIQITDDTSGDDRPWSFDTIALNAEWFLIQTAYFDDSGNTPNRIRRFTLVKYNTSNNTVTEHYSWDAAPATQNLIISIRVWLSQISDDHLLFLSNEDTGVGTVKAYIVPRV
jgi:hypothetical protein